MSIRHFFFLIFFAFVVKGLGAQTPDTLTRYTLADTALANRLLEEGIVLIKEEKNKEALVRLTKASEIYAQVTGRASLEYAKVYYQIGRANEFQDKYSEAIAVYEQVLDIRVEILGVQSLEAAQVYFRLGMVLSKLENFDKSIEFHNKALEIRKAILEPNHSDIVLSYNQLGLVLNDNGKYEEAINCHERAIDIKISNSGPESPGLVVSYNNLALCYNNLGKYKEAIDFFNKGMFLKIKEVGEEDLSVCNFYNNIGLCYNRMGNYDSGLTYHLKALSIREKKLKPDDRLVISSLTNAGISFEGKGDYFQALKYFQKALDRVLLSNANSTLSASCYDNLGIIYQDLGDFDKAYENMNNALSVRLSILGNFHPSIGDSYNNLGNLFSVKGELNKSIEYRKKALELRQKILPPLHPDLAASYKNLGISYSDFDDYEKAASYFGKALSIERNILQPDHPNIALTYRLLARAYYGKSDYEKSKYYYKESLPVSLSVLGENHPEISAIYNNMSVVYQDALDLDSALYWQNKALNIRLKSFGEEHPETAESYNNLGSIYFEKGDYEKSIAFIEKALEIRYRKLWIHHPDMISSLYNLAFAFNKLDSNSLTLHFLEKAITSLAYDKQYDFFKTSDIDKLVDVLSLAKAFYLKQYFFTHSRPQLDTALSYAQQALAALQHQQNNISTEGSKAQLLESNYGVYENAIQTSLLTAALDGNDSLRRAAFDYAEQSKAAQLRAKIKENDALRFANIPGNLLEQEYNLRVDIAWRERQRREKLDAGLSETDSVVLAISSHLFDLRQQYDTLRGLFKQEYPAYYDLKYQLATTSAAALQQDTHLQNQTLLEYFVGDSAIFVFVVNKDDFHTIELKKDFPLDSLVAAMRRAISDRYDSRIALTDAQRDEAPAAYCRSAHLLYEKLILPVKDRLKPRLLIIPDGALSYLPFEALLTENPATPHRFSGHPYLLRNHSINYCYSATLWKEMREKQHRQNPTEMVLGMAPYFSGDTTLLSNLFTYTDQVRKDLLPLPFAGIEVANITKLMGGTPRYGDEANKPAFDSLAPHYRILHLATHGQANDRFGEYSFLAFSEKKDSSAQNLLYVRDLYNYSLNADLVTLSACETGLGELQRGEGVVSLARAFSYAGAKSIVTSLWSVSDKKTQELMLNFYSFLSKGRSK
ncbi:MAG: tetratricopeptide repeat protein, partial [Saprospiraceae bacterium]|nr:tetratricopeptide repeat protein [Saprospiraceae bacterium]